MPKSAIVKKVMTSENIKLILPYSETVKNLDNTTLSVKLNPAVIRFPNNTETNAAFNGLL